jgi:ketosteroid isomerase-like protein
MTKKEIVTAYSVALGSGDIPKAFSFFSEDVKWHQPGKNIFSGVKNGATEIGEMFGKMMEVTEGSLAIAPAGDLMESGHLVAAPVRFSAKSGHKKMEMNGTDIYEVTDGKIVNVWLFSENQDDEDVFWGKE